MVKTRVPDFILQFQIIYHNIMYIIYKSKQNVGMGSLFIYFIILFFLIYLMSVGGFRLWIVVLIFVDVFLFLNFYKLNFLVTSEGIEFGFGLFKRKIKKEYIDSVFVDSSLGNFKSVGIIFRAGVWGFVAKESEGLKIICSSKHKKTNRNVNFFVTQENPAQILEIMKKQKYV